MWGRKVLWGCLIVVPVDTKCTIFFITGSDIIAVTPNHYFEHFNYYSYVIHTLSSHLRLGLPNVPFPLDFPTKILYTPLLSSIRATCLAHPILLDLMTRTIFGEQYRSLSSSFCSFLHSPVTSPLLGPNILLNTLFSNTFYLRSSLNVSDQVSHPYNATGKIIILYYLQKIREYIIKCF